MEKYNFPGAIGCIDCTHISLVAPPIDRPEHPGFVYLDRKGFHSINCQIVCYLSELNYLKYTYRKNFLFRYATLT